MTWRPKWLLITPAALLLAALGAPVLAASGYSLAAFAIREFLSRVCHQEPERSFFLFGAPVAVCARCLGIYAGAAVGTLLRAPRAVMVRMLLAAGAFNLLDILTESTGLHGNWMLVRFTLGAILGAGLVAAVANGSNPSGEGTSNRRRGALVRLVRIVAAIALMSIVASAGEPVQAERKVVNNVLISPDLPRLRIRVALDLKYLGSFPFKLGETAGGERYVWAEAEKGRVKRLFAVQFEGFLPGVDQTYRFRMRTPVMLGRNEYSHNLWFYDDTAVRAARPPNEAGLTAQFLAEKRLTLDSELMMSRFARIVGEDKRHEIILFYWENLRDHGLTAKDFPEESPVQPERRKFGQEFLDRSLKAFSVED